MTFSKSQKKGISRHAFDIILGFNSKFTLMNEIFYAIFKQMFIFILLFNPV